MKIKLEEYTGVIVTDSPFTATGSVLDIVCLVGPETAVLTCIILPGEMSAPVVVPTKEWPGVSDIFPDPVELASSLSRTLLIYTITHSDPAETVTVMLSAIVIGPALIAFFVAGIV